MSDREIIRCQACKLNQFMTNSGNCRKCHAALKSEPVAVAIVTEEHCWRAAEYFKNFGANMRILRQAIGLSSLQLAGKAGMWRQGISRIENGRSIPDLQGCYRLAKALDIPPSAFIAFVTA